MYEASPQMYRKIVTPRVPDSEKASSEAILSEKCAKIAPRASNFASYKSYSLLTACISFQRGEKEIMKSFVYSLRISLQDPHYKATRDRRS